MEIDHHHNSGLDGDSEQSNVPDPNGHTEVVAHHPLQQQATRHSVESGKDEHQCFAYRVEDQIQQEKDGCKHDRQYDLEPLFRAQFKLILSGPMEGVAGPKVQPFLEQFRCLVYKAPIVFGVEIDIDITGELAVFIADHGWSTGERNPRNLLDRDLSARRCRQEYSFQRFHVIAEVTLVANIHRVALAAFNIFRHIHAANPRSNRFLNVSHRESVSGSFRAVDFHVEVKALRNTLRKERPNLRQSREYLLNVSAGLLNSFERRPLDLHSYGSLDAR